MKLLTILIIFSFFLPCFHTGEGASSKKKKKRKRKKQEDENNKEEEKKQFSKIESMMSGCNESLIASASEIKAATKTTLLISLHQRIDETQSKIDEFDEALEELDDGDTSSKKYLRLSRRRNETDLKLQNLRKETEQFDWFGDKK